MQHAPSSLGEDSKMAQATAHFVQADWVDLGKDVLYWRTGQARMAQHI
jgi:hypothetical protein